MPDWPFHWYGGITPILIFDVIFVVLLGAVLTRDDDLDGVESVVLSLLVGVIPYLLFLANRQDFPSDQPLLLRVAVSGPLVCMLLAFFVWLLATGRMCDLSGAATKLVTGVVGLVVLGIAWELPGWYLEEEMGECPQEVAVDQLVSPVAADTLPPAVRAHLTVLEAQVQDDAATEYAFAVIRSEPLERYRQFLWRIRWEDEGPGTTLSPGPAYLIAADLEFLSPLPRRGSGGRVLALEVARMTRPGERIYLPVRIARPPDSLSSSSFTTEVGQCAES